MRAGSRSPRSKVHQPSHGLRNRGSLVLAHHRVQQTLERFAETTPVLKEIGKQTHEAEPQASPSDLDGLAPTAFATIERIGSSAHRTDWIDEVYGVAIGVGV